MSGVRDQPDQRVMVFGAGTAGAGIAHQIYEEFMQQGLSSDEAKQHIYLVDKQGLLTCCFFIYFLANINAKSYIWFFRNME